MANKTRQRHLPGHKATKNLSMKTKFQHRKQQRSIRKQCDWFVAVSKGILKLPVTRNFFGSKCLAYHLYKPIPVEERFQHA